MEQRHTFLAFDCGATSGRGILATFGPDGFRMEEVCRFPNQILELGGKYYWNVYSIYEEFLKCLTDLGRKGIEINSIGIDTWGVDFGCIAPDGSLLGLPRAYRDPYTAGVPEEVFKTLPREELYDVTGIQIMDFNTIFQLYAQTREGAAPLAGAREILFMPDLLSYLLTGNKVCEYTDASTSGMMNQRTRQFAGELLDRLDVRSDILRPIVQPGTLVGTLRPSIAASTGVGPVPVIAVAGHDTASAIAAVPAADGHFAYLSSGTWSLMGIEVPQPVINAESARLNFTNEGGIEGTTRFLKNITGMWLLEQCRKVWKAAGREYTYAEMVDMAKASESYAGRIHPDDPRFANPADMDAEIRRALAESGQSVPQSDGEMIRCIYRSLACRYKEVLDMLRGFAPFPIEKLHVIGGGSANAYLNQLTADTLGIPVVAGPTEATAIGNVMLQAQAAGLVADRWDMRRLVADAFAVQTFYPAK
ncbi:MAG: rhamnulokinase [Bacteroidales bacterium]|nr:rhamnulokinase [Bacteroidales bacterium]